MSNLSMIDAISNPSTNVIDQDKSDVSKASTAKKKFTDDFDEFMLLLTTQLKNQDPTEPMDTNQFTQQLVQFASVEQAIASNENLEKLVALTSNQQINSAVSFVGKTVDAEGNVGFLEDSQAEFAYDIPAGASGVTLAVMDQNGTPVYSTTGPTTAGRHIFAWDGTNSFTGKKMPDGIYTFGVAARDAESNTLEVKTYTTGRVTGIAMDKEEMLLTIGGVFDVTMDKITSVREPVQKPAEVDPSDDEETETETGEVETETGTESTDTGTETTTETNEG
jgi:flagellar basal-body rod modification protein FlgD